MEIINRTFFSKISEFFFINLVVIFFPFSLALLIYLPYVHIIRRSKRSDNFWGEFHDLGGKFPPKIMLGEKSTPKSYPRGTNIFISNDL